MKLRASLRNHIPEVACVTVFVKPSSNSINPSILEETIKELAPFRQRHLFLIVEEDFDMNAYQDVQQDFFILEQRNKVGNL